LAGLIPQLQLAGDPMALGKPLFDASELGWQHFTVA
jgi:hypothetical protein